MAPREADRLRVVTFNVWQGQHLKELRGNLHDLIDDTGHPEVLCLQEAHRLDGDVNGYTLIGPPFPNRDAGTAFLVRKRGVDVTRVKFPQVDGPGWVWNGNRRNPRTWPDITVDNGRRWDLLGIHRTPGGPRPKIAANARSWEAEDAEIEDWAARRDDRWPGRPRVAVGDWNARALDRRRLGLAHLARRLGGNVAVKGIDGGIVVNAHCRARKLSGRYGSDAHRPVVLDITA